MFVVALSSFLLLYSYRDSSELNLGWNFCSSVHAKSAFVIILIIFFVCCDISLLHPPLVWFIDDLSLSHSLQFALYIAFSINFVVLPSRLRFKGFVSVSASSEALAERIRTNQRLSPGYTSLALISQASPYLQLLQFSATRISR